MAELPNKIGAQVVNKAVLQVTVGSGSGPGLVGLTRKATEAKIREDMLQVVSSVGKRGGVSTAPRIVLLATQWLIKRGVRPMGFGGDASLRWRSEISQACERIMAARIKSRAYIAAGWLAAAKDLAAKVPGHGLTRLKPRNIPTRDDASAAESFARFATSGHLSAGVYNTSRGAGVVCPDSVIQQAVDNETKDLRKYLDRAFTRSIGKILRGFNPDDVFALAA